MLVFFAAVAAMPRTPWENDEFLFAEAVGKFEPAFYHPHPPGYPLYVLLGKAVNELVNDRWRALVLLAVVAAPVGFVALARAFRRWMDDPDLAVCGALLFYFSAAFLVNGTLALSDSVALTFVCLTLYMLAAEREVEHDRAAVGLGLWSSAAIGCRPQLLIPMIPLLAFALVRLPTNRKRLAAIVTFALVSLMWFLPLLDAAGGPHELMMYETKQARYFATHDAAMSRGAKSAAEIATHFIVHPWGSKYITLPLMLILLLGIVPAWRRRRELLPLAVFSGVSLAFALGWMDPSDAARYSLPSMLLTAAIVAFGFGTIRASTHFRPAPWIAAAIFAVGSWAYVKTIIKDRTTIASPPAAAAAYVSEHFPPQTVVLWDAALRPAVEYLLPQFASMAIERGLTQYYDRSEVPLVLFVDGGSQFGDTHVFSWHESDAFGKLTRNHYRVVTLDPVTPQERYLPISGVYAMERTVEGEEWRWLTRDATIRLPSRLGNSVELRFRLSHDAPYETNDVRVFVNGVPGGSTTARKGATATVVVPRPPGSAELRIVSTNSFLPSEVLHNQDPRSLATQLVYLIQR